MLDYQILDNKPSISIQGEVGIDLLHKSFDMDKEMSGDFLEVNEYYVARPDLISLAIYGDDKYGDIICKVNGISNPFELNEGMLIFIPSYETIINLLTKPNSNTTEVLEIESSRLNINNNKKSKTTRSLSFIYFFYIF